MSKCNHPNLHSYLRQLGVNRFPLVLHKAKTITSQSIEALSHLHLKAEVAHRDIKPENIVANESTYGITIKLRDFGLACSLGIKALYYSLCGTFPFMSPKKMTGPHTG